MIKSELTIELYKAFRPYVKKKQLSDYDNSFLKRKVKDEKLILSLLKKYIDLESCSKKPKNEHDILIINFALVELPLVGLKYTKLFKDYLKKEKRHLKKNVG
ncbi:MAG: hypothetical protein CMC14_00750 [Flavobacteriaceae bacterium]|nr:hypothetical protein [Flavobacteriaceae bacterium]|tara:strand:- start:93 stop:398 length:306 start_codon:yes stop_codon:yes gene_type:complete